jgi:hypothetical protein
LSQQRAKYRQGIIPCSCKRRIDVVPAFRLGRNSAGNVARCFRDSASSTRDAIITEPLAADREGAAAAVTNV